MKMKNILRKGGLLRGRMVLFRWSAMILIFLLALFAGRQSYSLPNSGNEPLIMAMDAAGIEVKEAVVSGWSDLAVMNPSAEHLEAIIYDAMSQLGVETGKYSVAHYVDPHKHIVRGEAVTDQFRTVISGQVLNDYLNSGVPAVYLVIYIEGIDNYRNLANWKEKISSIITRSGGRPRLTTCLAGWLDGKLEKKNAPDRLEWAFQAINATISDTIHQKNFISCSGFTTLIPDFVQAGDKLINVNMAMRYIPAENRTYIVIGSPVITKEH